MRKKKRMTGIAVTIAVFSFGVWQLYHGFSGVTEAYFSNWNEKINMVKIGNQQSHIEEIFVSPDTIRPNQKYEKKVTVKNDTETPCYVRIFVEQSNRDILADFDFNTKEWTEKQDDGYYYYKTVLGAQKETEPVFTSVHVKDRTDSFSVIIYEETVQAAGYETPQKAFESIRGK